MARKPAPSQAERLRDLRELFLLAMELGCTPAQARVWREKQASIARDRAATARLQARLSALPRAAAPTPETMPPAEIWWRDI